MKTLQALQFGANNVLNREQLKKVTGGTVKPPDECKNACTQDDPCTTGQVCTSAACPDDPTFTHYICVYSAA